MNAPRLYFCFTWIATSLVLLSGVEPAIANSPDLPTVNKLSTEVQQSKPSKKNREGFPTDIVGGGTR